MCCSENPLLSCLLLRLSLGCLHLLFSVSPALRSLPFPPSSATFSFWPVKIVKFESKDGSLYSGAWRVCHYGIIEFGIEARTKRGHSFETISIEGLSWVVSPNAYSPANSMPLLSPRISRISIMPYAIVCVSRVGCTEYLARSTFSPVLDTVER